MTGSRKNHPDTIAAIATPTGSGGIGIIRISGPESLSILNKVFAPQNPKSKPIPYLLRFGRIVSRIDGRVLDEVLAAYMPGPRSFTGENMVEIYCHAGLHTLKSILDSVLQVGCRPAEAGEFSMRRFLNHGVDLSKLEGAAEIIAAKTDLAYRISREHLLGHYGEHVTALRQNIVHLLAEIEADIDFPDEDSIGRIGRDLLHDRLDGIVADLEQLAASYKSGKIIQDGYRVIILGPPNSGKSSLFNRLVRQNRALVTPVPGTTRDYISEWIDVDGLPVELYDTAGLRTGRGRVEKAGIEGTRAILGRADLILYLFDITGKARSMPPIKVARGQQLQIALNKVDLVSQSREIIERWQNMLGGRFEPCIISARTGRGLRDLLKRIRDLAGVANLTESLVVTSHRHKVKIDACLKHLRQVKTMISAPVDIIAFELRRAADRIGEITGHIYTEEILDEIFSTFCIGK